MAKTFDYRGLTCPIPLLKMSAALMKKEIGHGEVIDVQADCSYFPEGLKQWCVQTKSTLLTMRNEAGVMRATIKVG